jgi:hypothetical protein
MLPWNSETNVGAEVKVGVQLSRSMENGNGNGNGSSRELIKNKWVPFSSPTPVSMRRRRDPISSDRYHTPRPCVGKNGVLPSTAY